MMPRKQIQEPHPTVTPRFELCIYRGRDQLWHVKAAPAPARGPRQKTGLVAHETAHRKRTAVSIFRRIRLELQPAALFGRVA